MSLVDQNAPAAVDPNAAPATPPAVAPAAAAPAARQPLALGDGGDPPAAPPAAAGAAATPPKPGDPAAATPPAQEWSERRKTLAGDNKALLGLMERYTSEQAFANAHLSMAQKIQTGELKPVAPYPEKGTDEEKAAWHKANGVPDKPEVYVEKIKLPDGMVMGELDKPGMERLAKFAQGKRWTQDQYNAVLEAYNHEKDAAVNARDIADEAFHRESEDKLRADWGPQDYRRNVNAVHNLLAGAPEEVKKNLFGGRTADGRMIGDHPEILKWLAQVAMDVNPAAAVLPPNIAPSQIGSRMAEIEAMRKDPNSEYYIGPKSKDIQGEELKLIEAQDRQAKRPRAA